MKRAIITATPELVREMFQIPDGAIVREIRHSFDNPGIIEFSIEGAGWETIEGSLIQHAEAGTVSREGDKLIIDWKLPDSS